jgi:hypothetical protein
MLIVLYLIFILKNDKHLRNEEFEDGGSVEWSVAAGPYGVVPGRAHLMWSSFACRYVGVVRCRGSLATG